MNKQGRDGRYYRVTCASCKFWSEMLAINSDAYCLNRKSQYNGKYVRYGCKHHEYGQPVDIDSVPLGQQGRSIAAREEAIIREGGEL